MSKAVINAIALLLPLATVYYWFEVREPVDADAVTESRVLPASTYSKPEGRSCLSRTDDRSVEMKFRADCDTAEDGRSADTLGQATETLQGQVVVTGYDL